MRSRAGGGWTESVPTGPDSDPTVGLTVVREKLVGVGVGLTRWHRSKKSESESRRVGESESRSRRVGKSESREVGESEGRKVGKSESESESESERESEAESGSRKKVRDAEAASESGLKSELESM
eukprot:gene9988-biopygen19768